MKNKKKHQYKGGIDKTSDIETKSDYGSGILSLSAGIFSWLLENIANKVMKVVTFISNHSESVFYHFLFILSYVICLTTLKNTNDENIRFLIIIFILLLHLIFLFAFLNTDVVQTLAGNLVSFSTYIFGTGWLILLISISFVIRTYSVLYKKFSENRMKIDFNSLDADKNKYFYYFLISIVWMWSLYILERFKVLFFEIFNKYSILNTFLLIIGAVFIALSYYTAYLSYNLANSVKKINLPPLNSFQSFYGYFEDLANSGAQAEYQSSKEGFIDIGSLINTKTISESEIKQKANDNYEETNADELINKDSTINMMDRIGLDTNKEFTTSSLSLNEYCNKQSTNNSNNISTADSNLNVFLLSKSTRDIYYITNNPKYSTDLNVVERIQKFSNNGNINDMYGWYSVLILSYSSKYKENTQNEFMIPPVQPGIQRPDGIYLLDYANNIYNIQAGTGGKPPQLSQDSTVESFSTSKIDPTDNSFTGTLSSKPSQNLVDNIPTGTPSSNPDQSTVDNIPTGIPSTKPAKTTRPKKEIKIQPSDKVNITIYPSMSNYQPTNITIPIGANGVGTFLLAPDNADLFYIKTQYTTTRSVEIYGMDIMSQYQKFKVKTGTPLLFDGKNACTWSAPLDPSNDVDKAYMDKIGVKDYDFNLIGGIGTYLLNSKRDLYFIKTVDTDSKMVEIHGLSASSNYQSFCAHYITALRVLYVSDNSTKPIGNKWASFGIGTFDLDNQDNLIYMKPISRDSNDLINSMSIITLSAAKKYKKFIN